MVFHSDFLNHADAGGSRKLTIGLMDEARRERREKRKERIGVNEGKSTTGRFGECGYSR